MRLPVRFSSLIFKVPFLWYSGMALFPFVLVKSEALKSDVTLIRHEKIHLAQQLEMLVLPFYLVYVFNYLFNLAIYRQHNKAYREIIFEREAYANELNSEYLRQRRMWSFLKYV